MHMQKVKKAPCTCIIIAVNVLIFLGLSMHGMTEDADYMLSRGAMYVPDMIAGRTWYPIFTSMFLHFGIDHLINNMVVLMWGGMLLEFAAGSVRMLVIYLVSGVCGNLLSGYLEFLGGSFAVSAGASGAIFGVTGALLYIAIRNRGDVYGFSRRSLIIMIVLNLYIGLTSEGVDNAAHVGGLIAGFVMAVFLYHKKSRRGYREADREYGHF